jgi:hypothetical protein
MKAADRFAGQPAAPHLDNALLIAAADRELSAAEAVAVESHLSICSACRARFDALAALSDDVAGIVSAPSASGKLAGRERLAAALAAREQAPADHVFERAMERYGWAIAAAALLAVCVLVFQQKARLTESAGHPAAAHAQMPTIDVNGESFLPLPYSNEDLPLNSSHVVEMQVPLSSLASAGIVLEPGAGAMPGMERTALADVLVGMDGQPLGVHVLSVD